MLRTIASKVQTPRMCASNSSPAKQAFTWTGSIQQFPAQLGSTRLPTNQEPPFQSLYSNSQPVFRPGLINAISSDHLSEDQMASCVTVTPCNDIYLIINQEILLRQVEDLTACFRADHS